MFDFLNLILKNVFPCKIKDFTISFSNYVRFSIVICIQKGLHGLYVQYTHLMALFINRYVPI